jgi:hypothetical protein
MHTQSTPTNMSKKSPTSPTLKVLSFVDPKKDKYLNPVEYCNNNLDWETVLELDKTITVTEEGIHISMQGGEVETLPLSSTILSIPDRSLTKLPPRHPLSKFTCLSILKFKGNYNACMSYITLKYQSSDIPYIRVGTDYFKVIYKKDRYGFPRPSIKAWKKEAITLDHTSSILTNIPRFDDFCIEPNNVHFEQTIDNLYNLYAQFTHKPSPTPPSPDQIPASLTLMRHIFGEQYEMGLQYMKLLYERPKQALPVLSLLSSERQTGKTTFINWIHMIFGDNYVLIDPSELGKEFNSIYANKNIIAIDETVIEKTTIGEKLKSLATAKSISVNQKHVANYMIPFYAKIILCTNKELDFMRIDDEEIRFWVRHVPHIKVKNTRIEDELGDEIPLFLSYLTHCVKMPDFSHSRMVFTSEQIDNKWLQAVKEESRSGLYKEIFGEVEGWFLKNPRHNVLEVAPKDIKNEFFPRDHNISVSYIKKVLRDEFKLSSSKVKKYRGFDADSNVAYFIGRPVQFHRNTFVLEDISDSDDENDGFDRDDEPPF